MRILKWIGFFLWAAIPAGMGCPGFAQRNAPTQQKAVKTQPAQQKI